MLRVIRWTAIGLIALLAMGWGAVWQARRDPAGPVAGLVRAVDAGLSGRAEGRIPSGSLVGGPFTLVDNNNHPVTEASFRGRWMLVYFGYTFCPDVCPTTLQTIVSALDELGPKAAAIAPIFVTVDPNRDTVEAINQYVALFDPRLVGLTGTPSQINSVAQEYRVYHTEVTSSQATSYLVDHSSFVYLMNPRGKFSRLFPAGVSAGELSAGISEEMDAAGQ